MFPTQRYRAIVAGFVGALVVLAALFWFVGVGQLVATLAQANFEVLVLVAVAAAVWLLAWSLALRTVLAILEIRISVLHSVLIFAATVFANNVTPFGQAGGEPVSALLISDVTDSEYETGFAAIVSVDALNLLPPIGFALLGLCYYAVTASLSEQAEAAGLVLLTLSICLPLVGLTLWRRRDHVRSLVTRGLTTVLGAVGRVIPRWRSPDPAAVDARVGGAVAALERIAGEPWRVTIAFSFSILGWLGLIVCLWLSLVALGFRDPQLLAAAFVAIPLGSVGAATPFPGGLGGIEAAFVAVLTPITGLPTAVLGAAVVIYRIATYWIPTVIGGAAASAYGSTNRW